MSTISINDLKKQSADQWRKSVDKDNLIVTSQGQPVAVLLPVDAKSLQPTLSALRGVRAVQAQVALQQAAEANGTSRLSMDDIDAEIKPARRLAGQTGADPHSLLKMTKKPLPPKSAKRTK